MCKRKLYLAQNFFSYFRESFLALRFIPTYEIQSLQILLQFIHTFKNIRIKYSGAGRLNPTFSRRSLEKSKTKEHYETQLVKRPFICMTVVSKKETWQNVHLQTGNNSHLVYWPIKPLAKR
jgi:hypothetical protein